MERAAVGGEAAAVAVSDNVHLLHFLMGRGGPEPAADACANRDFDGKNASGALELALDRHALR